MHALHAHQAHIVIQDQVQWLEIVQQGMYVWVELQLPQLMMELLGKYVPKDTIVKQARWKSSLAFLELMVQAQA